MSLYGTLVLIVRIIVVALECSGTKGCEYGAQRAVRINTTCLRPRPRPTTSLDSPQRQTIGQVPLRAVHFRYGPLSRRTALVMEKVPHDFGSGETMRGSVHLSFI